MTRPRRTLDDDTVTLVKAMWMTAEPVMAICEATGCSQYEVDKIRRDAGLPARQASAISKARHEREQPPKCQVCTILLAYAGGCPVPGCKHHDPLAAQQTRPELATYGVHSNDR